MSDIGAFIGGATAVLSFVLTWKAFIYVHDWIENKVIRINDLEWRLEYAQRDIDSLKAAARQPPTT